MADVANLRAGRACYAKSGGRLSRPLPLVVFGFVAAFSIGLPFLVVGLAMLLLGPFRGRPRLFLPALLAVVAFVVAASLVVPWSCEASSTSDGGSFTVCRGILGPTWAGPGVYNPPPEASWLGVIAGLVAGGVSGAGTYLLMARAASRRFLTIQQLMR